MNFVILVSLLFLLYHIISLEYHSREENKKLQIGYMYLLKVNLQSYFAERILFLTFLL